MTYEELVSKARELPLSQCKQLISELVESLTESVPAKEHIFGLHAGSTVYISDDFADGLSKVFTDL